MRAWSIFPAPWRNWPTWAGGPWASAGEAEQTLDQVLDDRPTVLVLGSEGEGVRRLVAEHCDVMGKLPMPGGFESLNVSAAAAVALYEASKFRPRDETGS